MADVARSRTIFVGIPIVLTLLILFIVSLTLRSTFQAGLSVAVLSLITIVIVAVIGSALLAVLTKQKEGFFSYFMILVVAQLLVALVVANILPLFGGLLG